MIFPGFVGLSLIAKQLFTLKVINLDRYMHLFIRRIIPGGRIYLLNFKKYFYDLNIIF